MPKAKAPAKKADTAKGSKETKSKATAAKTKAITKAPAATAKAKAKAAAPKAATKAVEKKPAVAPKKGAKTTKEIKQSKGSQSLDLCLILDCTASMGSWIERSKDTLHQIIDHVKAENEGLTVRVGFVAYRDFTEGPARFAVTDFTTDIDRVKKIIQSQSAMGGGDMPEDVQGGYNKALGLSWQEESIKSAFHIADAPGHGKDINGGGSSSFGTFDSYPNGSPEGFKIQDQMREFAKR